MPQPHAPAARTAAGAATALVALGGNLATAHGGPAATMRAALTTLERAFGAVTPSRIWTSPAHPAGSGPDYANAVCRFIWRDGPEALLTRLQAIEADFGRERVLRWGARTLDLDLLALDGLIRPDIAGWRAWRDLSPERQARETPAGLILPHPRLQDRAFVLLPLAEVAPDWRHPVTGESVATLCNALPAGASVGMAPVD